MVGLNRRQGREFTLDGSVEGVGGRRRTRRLNRRKRRHLASKSSLWVRSYCRDDEPKGGCLAPQHLRFREPKVGQLTPVDWEDRRDASWHWPSSVLGLNGSKGALQPGKVADLLGGDLLRVGRHNLHERGPPAAKQLNQSRILCHRGMSFIHCAVL